MGSSSIAFVALLALGAPADRTFDLTDSQLECVRLDNGMIVFVSVHPTEKEYFAVHHRFGLLDDAVGETQWTHLLEHLAVRVTDASDLWADLPVRDDLEPGKISVNGETSARLMRLEAVFPADDPRRLEDVFPRAKAWTGFEIAKEHAATEAERAAFEVDFTARGGHAHKWVYAAWNQARRGAPRVELRGGILSANPDDLARAASRLRGSIPPVLLFHGGLSEQVVLEFARSIPPPPEGHGIEEPPSRIAAMPSHIEWDFPRTVVVATCELAIEAPGDRLFGTLAARMMHDAFGHAPRIGLDFSRPLCSFEVDASGTTGRWFLTTTVSARVPPSRVIENLSRAFEALQAECDDLETLSEAIELARDRSFGSLARFSVHANLGAKTPHEGAQEALEAVQHRIAIDAFTDDEVVAVYSGFDPMRAAESFATSVDRRRWSWLTLVGEDAVK